MNKMIIALQKPVGIDGNEEDARAGWRKMSDSQRTRTIAYYEILCKEK